MRQCLKCKGFGKIAVGSWPITCDRCNGSGKAGGTVNLASPSGQVAVVASHHNRYGEIGAVVSLVLNLDGATVASVGVRFSDGLTEYFLQGQLAEQISGVKPEGQR